MRVVAVDLHRHLLAELLPSRAAMVALGAALIMVHHHALTDMRLLCIDGGAGRDHHAAGFVSGDHGAVLHRDAGGLRLALRAAVLMQVAAAHAGRLHFDDDVMSIRSGIGELHQFQSALAREYNAAHRVLPCFCWCPDLGRKNMVGKGRTWSDLARLITGSSVACSAAAAMDA